MTTTRIHSGSSGLVSPIAISGPTHQTIADKASTPTSVSIIGWNTKCRNFFMPCPSRRRRRDHQRDLDATIAGPAGRRGVAVDRLGVGPAFGAHALRLDRREQRLH